ncbi:MAG: DUF871 domain-containing protein [Schwartzia sp. (in: firmicutes)]
MNFGISVYPGLGTPIEAKLALIRRAAASGMTRLFTSLHIPETNKKIFVKEWQAMLAIAHHEGLEVIADVSPSTLSLFSENPFDAHASAVRDLSALRLDDGFLLSDIARLSQSSGHLRLLLNASTFGEPELSALQREGADFTRLEALHNFYPRPGTGLSLAFFCRQNDRLRRYGLSTGAFIPSAKGRRAPLHEGLPTLEMHRTMPPELAARHLAALGVGAIFIGDDKPSEAEIAHLTAIAPDTITLCARLLVKDTALQDLLSQPFTARPDAARDAIRAMEGRTRFHDLPLPPENTLPRPFGAITVDNQTYPRYAGELQIIKRPQCADPRTNVVAQVFPEEEFLIPLIRPGQKFTLRFV